MPENVLTLAYFCKHKCKIWYLIVHTKHVNQDIMFFFKVTSHYLIVIRRIIFKIGSALEDTVNLYLVWLCLKIFNQA